MMVWKPVGKATPDAPTIRDCIRAGADSFGIDPAVLSKPSRIEWTMRARNCAMYLARRLGHSSERISVQFGNSRRTVSKAYNDAVALAASDWRFAVRLWTASRTVGLEHDLQPEGDA